MILITGGTGFLGQNIVKKLQSENYPIRLLCRDKEKAQALFPKAEVVKGDILDKGSLIEACKGVKTVIHLAAVISYTLPEEKIFLQNVEGTKNLLEAAKNADKFIFSSSTSVYGATVGKASENTPPNPRTSYGKSKVAAEKVIIESGIPFLVYRISVVYGQGSPIWYDIMKFFGKGFPIPKAHSVINLIHISDVASAFQIGVKKGNGIYNIAGEKSLPFRELASILSYHLGRKPRFWPTWLVLLLAQTKGKAKKELEAFITNRDFENMKAKKELGFVPKAILEKELKNMVEWYKNVSSKNEKHI